MIHHGVLRKHGNKGGGNPYGMIETPIWYRPELWQGGVDDRVLEPLGGSLNVSRGWALGSQVQLDALSTSAYGFMLLGLQDTANYHLVMQAYAASLYSGYFSTSTYTTFALSKLDEYALEAKLGTPTRYMSRQGDWRGTQKQMIDVAENGVLHGTIVKAGVSVFVERERAGNVFFGCNPNAPTDNRWHSFAKHWDSMIFDGSLTLGDGLAYVTEGAISAHIDEFPKEEFVLYNGTAGVISSQSEYSPTYAAYKAMNSVHNTYFLTQNLPTYPQWWQFAPTNPVPHCEGMMMGCNAGINAGMPKDFDIEIDGVVVKSFTNITWESKHYRRYFFLDTPVPVNSTFRLIINANNGHSNTNIQEIRLLV